MATALTVLNTLTQAGAPLTLRELQHRTGGDWSRLYGATVELEDAGQLRCLASRRPWRYEVVKKGS